MSCREKCSALRKQLICEKRAHKKLVERQVKALMCTGFHSGASKIWNVISCVIRFLLVKKDVTLCNVIWRCDEYKMSPAGVFV